jgi:hypothetical protein
MYDHEPEIEFLRREWCRSFYERCYICTILGISPDSPLEYIAAKISGRNVAPIPDRPEKPAWEYAIQRPQESQGLRKEVEKESP